MRVLVCGGRDYTDRARVKAVLDKLRAERGIDALIHGGARGADALAAEWAAAAGVPAQVFLADWSRNGRAAGPIRNAKMLIEGRPALVVAFPGGRGTADMTRRARAAGVEIVEVNPL